MAKNQLNFGKAYALLVDAMGNDFNPNTNYSDTTGYLDRFLNELADEMGIQHFANSVDEHQGNFANAVRQYYDSQPSGTSIPSIRKNICGIVEGAITVERKTTKSLEIEDDSLEENPGHQPNDKSKKRGVFSFGKKKEKSKDATPDDKKTSKDDLKAARKALIKAERERLASPSASASTTSATSIELSNYTPPSTSTSSSERKGSKKDKGRSSSSSSSATSIELSNYTPPSTSTSSSERKHSKKHKKKSEDRRSTHSSGSDSDDCSQRFASRFGMADAGTGVKKSGHGTSHANRELNRDFGGIYELTTTSSSSSSSPNPVLEFGIDQAGKLYVFFNNSDLQITEAPSQRVDRLVITTDAGSITLNINGSCLATINGQKYSGQKPQQQSQQRE